MDNLIYRLSVITIHEELKLYGLVKTHIKKNLVIGPLRTPEPLRRKKYFFISYKKLPKPHKPLSSRREGYPNLSGPTTKNSIYFMCVFPNSMEVTLITEQSLSRRTSPSWSLPTFYSGNRTQLVYNSTKQYGCAVAPPPQEIGGASCGERGAGLV